MILNSPSRRSKDSNDTTTFRLGFQKSKVKEEAKRPSLASEERNRGKKNASSDEEAGKWQEKEDEDEDEDEEAMTTLKIANFGCLSESSIPTLLIKGSPPDLSSPNQFCIGQNISNRLPDRRLRVFADTATSASNADRFDRSSLNRRTRLGVSARGIQHSTIRSVPVQVAHELLNAGHWFLDVRTGKEFADGHIEGAINIPYMFKVGSGMTKNHKFLEDVKEMFGSDDEVVVGCQMGKRSQMAVLELIAAGFTGVTDMAGGYSAWVQSGMPIV